jgi:predicted enzyme related to lactoylglutathione lyase
MSRSNQIHHRINYIEFGVSDLTKSKGFYQAAFGWEFNDYGPMYAGIKGESGEVGGMRVEPTVQTGGPLVILYSNNLGASLEAVRTAGGKISQDPFAFPGGRRFHFTDPSGNELAVWSEK